MGLLSFIIKAAAIAAVGGAVGVVGAAAISAWMENSSSVSGSINQESAKAELGRRIKENLNSGNYNTVSLEATVVEIKEHEGTTYVRFEVENDKYGLKSTQGTTLHVNERLLIN